MFVGLIYLLFFLSGAAALVYQVVWVRSLTLVFGGSHLAVTAVLSIFMAGLALGGFAVGRRVDAVGKPLRLYGVLELGIAASALGFAGLMKFYPAVYSALAQGRDDATLYLTIVRLLFSVVALIVPTVLMGGTLPVLTRFVSGQPEHLRSHLAFLYGLNTLGAVLGALLAGFVFLRVYSVSTTLYIAVGTNLLIGAASILLQRTAIDGAPAGRPPSAAGRPPIEVRDEPAGRRPDTKRTPTLPRLVLWGVGLSGFCALGYEVLWTRILALAVGASVYGFTIILVAFLTGIALGSKAYGILGRVAGVADRDSRTAVAWFGWTEVAIGVTAFVVTVYLRDIPAHAVWLQHSLLGGGAASFQARVWANFTLAFLYMVVPAVFMGAAFPIAGEVVARHQKAVGRAVGDVLAANTVGAILGAAVSGLVMVRLFGIERSLQLLSVVNVGLGFIVLASLRPSRRPAAAVFTVTTCAIVFLALNQDAARIWDRKYFAIFRSNQPEAFSTPEKVREAVENTDVLYYAEGVESIVSVIRVRGGEQAFITNGRVEASSHRQARQVQFTLGHLPMLLNREPKQVLVVGMGSGMTAGATAVHPSVERVTLVEIEERVLGVARTFEQYNHHLLEQPNVRIVFNDGRNFLTTTDRMFDVITADPIHPWFRGAGYLYTSEYFALAARHLNPGGAIAQWLPVYELTPRDLASVVRTFQQHFAHTMMWLTHYDAVLIGSNAAFAIDEAELERRISDPAIRGDLAEVHMGSTADLLSYFVMGTEGMAHFGAQGTLNTDNHLYLEFSAPFSIATPALMAADIRALAGHRESILPFLKPAAGRDAREAQVRRWTLQLAAGRAADPVLARLLAGNLRDPAIADALRRLEVEYPSYAPGRALRAEYEAALAMEPKLLDQASFQVLTDDELASVVQVAAVLVPVSSVRASVMFVDNRSRTVFGEVYVDDDDRDGTASRVASEVLSALQSAYDQEAAEARGRGQGLPPVARVLARSRAVIAARARGGQPGS